jgi:GNAT superfamily N-acetyltransferase
MPVCLDAYRDFHNLLFKGAAISSEWVKWYHGRIAMLSGTAGWTRTYAAYHENLLVGIWSVEPKIYLDSSGHEQNVGRCFAVGIHPEYRRHGLFVALSRFAIQEERKLGHYEYIFGFPQTGRSVIGGHLKAGWESIRTIPVLSFNPAGIQSFTSRREVGVVSNFTLVHSIDRRIGGFLNTADYRNEKWLNHPDHQYICFSSGDSYIVLKPYGGHCHILDMQGANGDLKVLLAATKTLARRHGWHELNLWCAPENTCFKEVVAADFKEGSEVTTSVELIGVKIKGEWSLKIHDACHFQMGEEEPY